VKELACTQMEEETASSVRSRDVGALVFSEIMPTLTGRKVSMPVGCLGRATLRTMITHTTEEWCFLCGPH
jgi:hypothetical protein